MNMKTLLQVGVANLMVGAVSAQSLDEAIFRELHAQLNPAAEAWKAIPWKTDLLQAQRTAAQSKKPLFIWAMDGHPLGCT